MQIAFFQRRAEHRYDLALLDTADGSVRILASGAFSARPIQWSPDGNALSYSKMAPETDEYEREGQFVSLELDSGRLTPAERISPPRAPTIPGMTEDWAFWSPEKRWYAVAGRGEFQGVRVGTPDGKRVYQAFELKQYCFAAMPSWSPDGCHLSIELNAGDESGVYIVDLVTGTSKRITKASDSI